MNEEFEVLKLVCQRLASRHIPYMVTGSIAANFYAVPRMTRDIDIVIEAGREDALPIYELFKDDFYIEADTVSEEIKRRGMFNIIHSEFALKIDFIVRKTDEYRELEFTRRRSISVEGTSIQTVSIEDLILSKLIWAKDSLSAQQLSDVKRLASAEREIDNAYLEEWMRRLDLEAVFRRALE